MVRRVCFLAVLLLGVVLPGWAQTQRASLSGYVRDATSGETLLLANVLLQGTSTGTATNNAGYYTLTNLPPGTYTVVVSYIGYQRQEEEVTLEPGERRRLDLELVPEGVEVGEIVVTADDLEEEEVRNLGAAKLSTQAIRQLPTVFEPDVFRSLQLLPGVKAASDFSSGLYIRGGSPDQTLILLDQTTVYNPSHFFGFFSTFNPDAIKDVRLYKGGYPAEYGGRLGAVVDIYNKDGNRRDYEGGLTLGLLASRAIVEGPYPGGSWMLAFRRSTLDPLLAALNNADVDNIPESFYFYDLNGKFNFDVSQNNRLSLAFYAGQDALDFPFLDDARFDIRYGNRTGSLNWTHLFSDRLFSNFTFTASRYVSIPEAEISGTTFEVDNRVYDVSAKGDLQYVPNERHTLEAGFWAGNLTFNLRQFFDDNETFGQRLQSEYASIYVQETYQPSALWKLQGGVRANYFAGGNYWRFEPRVSVEYQPRPAVRFQGGYGRYYQFLTLVTSELFTAFDTWLTTDEGVPPAYGDQFVAGVKLQLAEDVNLDVEGYYRTMEDLFELDPLLPDVAGLDYADAFRFGQGDAVGTEFFLEKTGGRLNGFIGYTVGQTRRRFPEFNLGEDGAPRYYPPKFDRTHDVNAVVNYDLGRTWRLSSVFTYGTGQAYSEVIGQFKLVDDPFASNPRDVSVTGFNQFRLPAYHRLDLGLTKIGRFFGFADYEFQFQVINVYAQENIWFYFFEFEDNLVTREDIPQIPFPIPNLSLSLRF